MSGTSSWIPLALITAVCFGAYNIFIKLSAHRVHEMVGAVVLQAVAVLFGLSALAWLRWRGSSFEVTTAGVSLAVVAGLFVGAAEILSFYVFSTGVSASRAVPVIIGGSVIASVFLGLVFLGERLRWIEGLGVILVVAGIWLLSGAGR